MTMDIITLIFVVISYLGSEIFYMAILPPLVWLNRKEGIRALYLVLTGMYLGFIMKELFRMPRPPQELWLVGDVYGYGFPSGHALLAFAFWCYMALLYMERNPGRKILPVVFLFFAALVAFSRIYLRVHYTTDVVGGSIIGLILAGVFYRIHASDIVLSRLFTSGELKTLSIVIPLNLYFLGLLTIGEYDFLLIYKLSLLCSVIMGSSYAISLGHEYSPPQNKKDFILRIAIGMPVIFVMYFLPLILSIVISSTRLSMTMSPTVANIIVKWLQGILFSLSALYLVPKVFRT